LQGNQGVEGSFKVTKCDLKDGEAHGMSLTHANLVETLEESCMANASQTQGPVFTPARIVSIRGERVISDEELAALYGVPTKQLNQQVRRNRDRFPEDFCFQLTDGEWNSLRSQIATLKNGRGQHRKFLPYAFTEHGALMAAGVLNSPRAVQISIYIVRTFIAMRRAADGTKELAGRIDELERNLEKRFTGYDQAIAQIFAAIRALMKDSEPVHRPIGFVNSSEPSSTGSSSAAERFIGSDKSRGTVASRAKKLPRRR
jgi:hypothetical protein